MDGMRALQRHAPVFLWSVAGRENGERLLNEYSDLRSLVTGCFDKDSFPVERVRCVYCIDDEAVDEVVRSAHHFLVPTFNELPDPGGFLDAVTDLLRSLRSGTARTRESG